MKENMIALVTGGSSGIGRAIVERLAKGGYSVAFTYNENRNPAIALAENLTKDGMPVKCYKCDVTSEKQIDELIDAVLKDFGKIDVLVNNAGVASDHLFMNKTADIFKNTLNVNLIGPFLISKKVGNLMHENKSGKIINIASTNGINTYYPMCVDYDASKAGLISLTHNLAMQFAPYVNVNAIAPGFIATKNEIDAMDQEYIESETEKILLKRVGKERDVANLVNFLASDEAGFINNEVIRIDGGLYGSY